MLKQHLVFCPLVPSKAKQNEPKTESKGDPVLDRESLEKAALQERVDSMEKRLKDERDVRDYLMSQGKVTAVARVDRNIANLNQTLENYRKDLEAHGKE